MEFYATAKTDHSSMCITMNCLLRDGKKVRHKTVSICMHIFSGCIKSLWEDAPELGNDGCLCVGSWHWRRELGGGLTFNVGLLWTSTRFSLLQ